MKFHGTLDELKRIVELTEMRGAWRESPDSQKSHRFKSRCGTILNWWPSTGTVQFQGTDPLPFEVAVEKFLQRSLDPGSFEVGRRRSRRSKPFAAEENEIRALREKNRRLMNVNAALIEIIATQVKANDATGD